MMNSINSESLDNATSPDWVSLYPWVSRDDLDNSISFCNITESFDIITTESFQNVSIDSTNELLEIDTFSDVDWANLPREVLLVVFRHLPIEMILLSIPKVCQQWKDVLQLSAFWWEQLNLKYGILVSREHTLNLVKTIDQSRILPLLRATC